MCHEARHSGRDCRNPGYMDVFELAIHGTGYPLPGGYDEFLNIFVYKDEACATVLTEANFAIIVLSKVLKCLNFVLNIPELKRFVVD
jgi:hypothetical protein